MPYKRILFAILIIIVSWGSGRLYYAVTDGFTEANITYDLPFELRREVRSPSPEVKKQIDQILAQKFYYLGKGCQSYVFESEDGEYVLKFFKYQRFRPQEWIEFFSWIPKVEGYRYERYCHKRQKLDQLFLSWQVAYEDLSDETGLLFVKLSKNEQLGKTLVFYDKIGMEHRLNLDEAQFLIQRKAKMLCPTIEGMLAKGDRKAVRLLLERMLFLFLAEYERGYTDGDNAIMQNTGVIDGKPIHIDVGQLVKNNQIHDEEVWRQNLFNRTYKFRKWLDKRDHEICQDFEQRLAAIIGDSFADMVYIENPH